MGNRTDPSCRHGWSTVLLFLRFPPRSRLGSRLNSVGSSPPLAQFCSSRLLFPRYTYDDDGTDRFCHSAVAVITLTYQYSVLLSPRILHSEYSTSKTVSPPSQRGDDSGDSASFSGAAAPSPIPLGWVAEARDLSVLLLRGVCPCVRSAHTIKLLLLLLLLFLPFH